MQRPEQQQTAALGFYPPLCTSVAACGPIVLNYCFSPATESRPDRSGKAVAHFSSSPSLLDQPDGGARTLPPGMKLKVTVQELFLCVLPVFTAQEHSPPPNVVGFELTLEKHD